MLNEIIACISSYQNITIYPHQQADGDALGSAFGLKQLLADRYPEKTIRVLGNHTKDNGRMFPYFDEASDDFIRSSLAIVVDTANHERVDDGRYVLAKQSIKIDHHPGDDNYADINYVFPNVSSTAELVVGLAKAMYPNKPIPKDAATYLYAGVMSDTMSFSTASTNPASLEAAHYLATQGVNLAEVAYYFRAKSIEVYGFITELRSHLVIENNRFAYVIVNKEMYRKYGLRLEDIKGNVSEFSRIEGLLVWCIFLEQEDEVFQFQGSLRSRHVTINDIANQFHGGGHKFAAGVKLTSHAEVLACIDALRQRIQEEQYEETNIPL